MKILITGGAGFIGSNVAHRHLSQGDDVVILDNFSRKGCADNIRWLKECCKHRGLHVIRGDIRNPEEVNDAVERDMDVIYHMAGQVAVTCSVSCPREDFENNALGTFNILEAVRLKCPESVIIYASTNKVYGQMSGLPVCENETRYNYVNLPYGVSEELSIDFHTPYGCSKGCGDQYTRDYARTYGMRTVVFRQSCIYGPRQFGVEDQGWLAHFCIAAKNNRLVNIYGDGKQVRDVLWVDDLIDAYAAAIDNIDTVSGSVFNIGGGPGNTMSVWREFGPMLQAVSKRSVDVEWHPWRTGDQKIYVSDIRRACECLCWTPKTPIKTGVLQLWRWVNTNASL